MDLSRLSKGEMIFGGSAVLLFLSSFLGLWAKVEVDGFGDIGGFTERYSAWDGYGFTLKLALLIALAGAVLVILRAVGRDVPLPIPWGLAYAAGGAIVAVLLLLNVLMGPLGPTGDFGGIEISRGPLLFVGFLLGVAMAGGGYLHMQSEGSSAAPLRSPSAPPPPAG